jgi:hypothetical protein
MGRLYGVRAGKHLNSERGDTVSQAIELVTGGERVASDSASWI